MRLGEWVWSAILAFLLSTGIAIWLEFYPDLPDWVKVPAVARVTAAAVAKQAAAVEAEREAVAERAAAVAAEREAVLEWYEQYKEQLPDAPPPPGIARSGYNGNGAPAE